MFEQNTAFAALNLFLSDDRASIPLDENALWRACGEIAESAVRWAFSGEV